MAIEPSVRVFQPLAFIAPSFILRSLFGTMRSGSILMNEPRPVQVGQAPKGLLNENILGFSSSMLILCSGQA